jgi:phospholipase/lecithinase/hemolysin
MKRRVIFAGLAIAAAAIAPLPAQSASFSQLYTFGDSLVDPGNLFQATSQASPLGLPPFPQSPPYAQRLSNGPVWVEYLAESLELQPALFANVLLSPTPPDISDGIHFGFAGAGTGTENIVLPPLSNTGALAQAAAFADFFSDPAIAPAEDALFVYSAGANDIAGSTFVPPQTDVSVLLDNTAAALQILVQSGAKNVLTPNLPDISNAPRFDGDPQKAAISEQINAYNTGLPSVISQVSASAPDVNFQTFDFNGLFANAIDTPGEFGFTNVADTCLSDYTFPFDPTFTICDSPSEFLFWDDFHPTTQAHALVAQAALEKTDEPKAVPEPGGVLGLVATAATGFALRRRQILTGRKA